MHNTDTNPPPPEFTTADGPTAVAARVLPIALFSIPLGLAGLGGEWMAAEQLLDAPVVPAQLAFGTSAVVWAAFTATYLIGIVRHDLGRFQVDLRHPLFGPLTAYIPVIAILLLAYYAPELGDVGEWMMFASVTALAINAASLVAHWLGNPLEQDALHPGYFLPVVAGPFIATIGLQSIGYQAAALASFGVGVYFWLLLGAVITSRLFFGNPLPQPFKPVLSILLSPPATAGLAWFAITGGKIDDLQLAIGGITAFTLLIQLYFLPDYLRLPFSSQHWVFTFPLAVLGAMGVRWAAEPETAGWRTVAWVVLLVSTIAILAILAGTLRDIGRRLRRTASAGSA
jgi:tellurite resistance protein